MQSLVCTLALQPWRTDRWEGVCFCLPVVGACGGGSRSEDAAAEVRAKAYAKFDEAFGFLSLLLLLPSFSAAGEFFGRLA